MGEQQQENGKQARSFDPRGRFVQLKGKQGSQDYLQVKDRLVWFREVYPDGTVFTEEIEVDTERIVEIETFAWNNEKRRSEKVTKSAKGYARFKATVTNGHGGSATGTKTECAANFADYVEKAESGAVGRALSFLGFGTQSATEFDEGPRVVDAPVERERPRSSDTPVEHHEPSPTSPDGHPTPSNEHSRAASESAQDASITPEQIASIRKLSQHLGSKPDPEGLTDATYAQGKQWIVQLNAEYKEYRQKSGITPR
jgi:hypothetical protein